LNILQFIGKQDERGTGFLCGCANDLQQSLQIILEIAVVGKPRLGSKSKPTSMS